LLLFNRMSGIILVPLFAGAVLVGLIIVIVAGVAELRSYKWARPQSPIDNDANTGRMNRAKLFLSKVFRSLIIRIILLGALITSVIMFALGLTPSFAHIYAYGAIGRFLHIQEEKLLYGAVTLAWLSLFLGWSRWEAATKRSIPGTLIGLAVADAAIMVAAAMTLWYWLVFGITQRPHELFVLYLAGC